MCWEGDRTNHIKKAKVVDITMYQTFKIPTNKTKQAKQNKAWHILENSIKFIKTTSFNSELIK